MNDVSNIVAFIAIVVGFQAAVLICGTIMVVDKLDKIFDLLRKRGNESKEGMRD